MEAPTTENLEILKGIPLFTELNEADRTLLADRFSPRVFREGEKVFAEDTPGHSMMIIVSGEVRISSDDSGQGEETFTILKRGDFFGEMALLDELPRSATAIAHSDLILLEIERSSFIRFIND
ncbi:MAG TPA: cyclic nucleotide-binding domain-containing protein, partial [Candidatus Aminicenantes bacterium]|nr:cyclic nucleotide-binding domain-containing protein [Candidatus Aminicenantes bacterium]